MTFKGLEKSLQNGLLCPVLNVKSTSPKNIHQPRLQVKIQKKYNIDSNLELFMFLRGFIENVLKIIPGLLPVLAIFAQLLSRSKWKRIARRETRKQYLYIHQSCRSLERRVAKTGPGPTRILELEEEKRRPSHYWKRRRRTHLYVFLVMDYLHFSGQQSDLDPNPYICH